MGLTFKTGRSDGEGIGDAADDGSRIPDGEGEGLKKALEMVFKAIEKILTSPASQ
jgi:hypothetical protein